METLWQDVRYGFRMLAKQRGFSSVAVLTLALGIGANTAMFSIVNTVLLQPLPYREADRLVFVRDIQPQLPDLPGSYPEFLDWQEQKKIFEESGAYFRPDVTLTGEAEPEQVRAVRLTPGLLSLLNIPTLLGRPLEEQDNHSGAERVALLSYELWQRRFGGDRDILGRSITISGESTVVVGILAPGMRDRTPREFRRGQGSDIWLPLRLTAEGSPRGSHYLTVVARLQRGVTFPQAQAEIERVAQAFKDDDRTEHGIMLTSVPERIARSARTPVLVLMGAVGFVLLIACANIANLLLARTTARHKEIAIRAALGAGRVRLVRQLMTESVLLALGGGALGLLLAWWGVQLFSASAGAELLRTGEVFLDGAVLFFTLGVTFLTGLVFGTGPALHASATDLNATLKEGGRQPGAAGGSQAFRHALVVAEVALSLMLLVGAGLLLRSFQKLLDVNLGFDPQNLLTFQVFPPASKYPGDKELARFADQVLERVSSLPGVEGAAVVNTLPVEGGWNADFDVEGIEWPQGHSPLAEMRYVNPDYFRTLRVPLLQGRLLEEHDTSDARGVVVVDREFVRQVFGEENPMGRRIYFGGDDSPRWEIVGVVGTVQHWSIGREARPAIYLPYRQSASRYMVMAVRTAGDPLDAVATVRRQILAVDPYQPIARIRSMDQVIAGSLAQRRLSLSLLGAFALLALFLAALGLYGVISYSVSQRTHEIGIRMALGAQAGDILRLVVRQGVLWTLVGIALGLVGAFGVTRFLESLLFGVAATDPVTFVGISALLVAVALLACYLPARRATRVDPMVALRYE